MVHIGRTAPSGGRRTPASLRRDPASWLRCDLRSVHVWLARAGTSGPPTAGSSKTVLWVAVGDVQCSMCYAPGALFDLPADGAITCLTS
jgi:hypothetical protein